MTGGNRNPGEDHRPHLSLRGPKGAVAIRTPCRHFYPTVQQQARAQEGFKGLGTSLHKMTACRETDCHVASLLAMTGENEARAQTIDHSCHCEGRQARGNLKAPMDGRFRANDTSLRLPRRFAPRNDTGGGSGLPRRTAASQ